MRFDPLKFIKGFNIFDGEKFGKILYFAVLITVGGLIMWKLFIAPTQTDIQNLDARLNLQGASVQSVTIGEKPVPSKAKWSLLSIRLFASD